MDESGEAVEGRRGIFLKRMLGACARHSTSNIAISNEKAFLFSQWYWSGRGYRSRRKGIALHGFELQDTGDDSMVNLNDLILSI